MASLSLGLKRGKWKNERFDGNRRRKRVLKACRGIKIESYDDFYHKVYLCEKDLGIRDIDYDFILWVIANDKMTGSRCYGCRYVTNRCFTDIGKTANYCNTCENNPNPKLPVKYEKADKCFS